nr:hypothetical protein [Deltaproteobacteria bacterium]
NRFLLEAKKAPNEEAVKGYIVEVDACAKAQQQPLPTTTATLPTTAPEPQPQPQPITDEPPRSKKRLVGYIVGGSGVALGGLGFFFMSRVAALEEKANELCPADCVAWDSGKTDLREKYDDDARLREKLMAGSWIAGGAALAAGVYLVVTGGEKTESTISITPTKNGAMASFRF